MNDNRLYARVRSFVGSSLPVEAARFTAIVLSPADLVVLIGRAMVSPQVPAKTKGYLIFAGLYWSAGYDLIPEAILGPIGYTDDSIIVLEALHRLLNETDPEVIERLWPGDPQVLHTIQRWIGEAREGVQKYVVRPLVLWVRRAIGGFVAGRAG